MIKKQRRGTVILDTDKGILVAAGRSKVFLLPGGGAKRWESRRRAAVRELREETGLRTTSTHFLFRHLGKVHRSHGGGHFQDHHKVFLVKATGTPEQRHEIRYVAWYKPGSKIKLSTVTLEIVQKYLHLKTNGNQTIRLH